MVRNVLVHIKVFYAGVKTKVLNIKKQYFVEN